MQQKITIIERQNNEFTRRHSETKTSIKITDLRNQQKILQSKIHNRKKINDTDKKRTAIACSVGITGSILAIETLGFSLIPTGVYSTYVFFSNKIR